jgi:hypothetical protein
MMLAKIAAILPRLLELSLSVISPPIKAEGKAKCKPANCQEFAVCRGRPEPRRPRWRMLWKCSVGACGQEPD